MHKLRTGAYNFGRPGGALHAPLHHSPTLAAPPALPSPPRREPRGALRAAQARPPAWRWQGGGLAGGAGRGGGASVEAEVRAAPHLTPPALARRPSRPAPGAPLRAPRRPGALLNPAPPPGAGREGA